MAPRKLSDSDKSEIVDRYREPGQTTSTLAEQYGVSNSTISRILKTSIPSDEYSELIAQKRMTGSDKSATPARRRKTRSKAAKSQPTEETPAIQEFEPATNQPAATGSVVSEPAVKDDADDKQPEEKPAARRRRRRSRAADESNGQLPLLTKATESEESSEEEIPDVDDTPTESSLPTGRPKPILASQRTEEDEDEDEDDDLLGLDETLGDDFGDDDLDEEDEDEDEDDDAIEMPILKTASEDSLEIMPLGEAVLPKPCYLVVDMRAELITRPLVEFSDLGKIPSSEEREKTLPVFDNHRVARRFSRNKQRVIKVPDGNLITRTSPYLTAKGITRLLVDGQVFDLVGMD